MKKFFLKKIAVLIIFIFLVNLLAMKFHWYYSIPWFDLPMHFLGGLFISLSLLWLHFFRRFLEPVSSKNKSILITILGTLIIGILWEVFEFGLDTFIIFKKLDWPDTLSDLVMDLVGASVGLRYFFKKTNKLS